MIGWRRAHGASIGAVLLVAGGAARIIAPQRSFLDTTGAEAARCAGQRTLVTAAGEKTFDLAGVGPRHEQFTGKGLACRIGSRGSIAVEMARS